MKLNENRRQRLELLADNLSVDYNGETLFFALLCAVDREIGAVFAHLEKAAEDICVQDASGDGGALMLEILQKKADGLDTQEKAKLIAALLARPFGSYSSGSFAQALNEAAAQGNVTVGNKAVSIAHEPIESFASLTELCRLVNDFVPPFFSCTDSGSGMPFSRWDSFSASWYQLDKMNVPFYFIETFNIQE